MPLMRRSPLYLILTCALMVLGIFCVTTEALAQDTAVTTVRSKNKISGNSTRANIFFSAEPIDDDVIETDITVNNKRVTVIVGYGTKAGGIYISGRDLSTNEVVTITPSDAEALKETLEALVSTQVGANQSEKSLLRTLNLLTAWPQALLLSIDPTDVSVPSRCDITYPDGIQPNLCRLIGTEHFGRYASEGRYCGWASYSGVPTLKLNKPIAWNEDVSQNVGGSTCFGRCGKGCVGDGEPNNDVNIYTQSCFDHDLCVLNRGVLDAECNWMFISAIDDFFYGPDCLTGLDLIFVVDTTGSMWDDIANVKTAATDIVNSLDSQLTDYRVALVDYRDFPVAPYGGAGDYPYNAVLPFSTDTSAITNAIQSLSIGWGNDWRESVYSGLIRAIETENLGSWRNGVAKAVIVMGDAPPHDPEPFTGYTADDVVNIAEAVDPAVLYPIVIGGDSATYNSFAVLAERTGGKVFSAPNANDVVSAILDAIGIIITGENNSPDCSGAVADVSQVWPPNHKTREIKIIGAEDPDGDPLEITITGITQSEPVYGLFTNDPSPDGFGVGTSTASVRAERQGEDVGRVYRVSFDATDGRGGQCSGLVLTCVAHDQGRNTSCVDNGQTFDSTLP